MAASVIRVSDMAIAGIQGGRVIFYYDCNYYLFEFCVTVPLKIRNFSHDFNWAHDCYAGSLEIYELAKFILNL